MEQLEAALHYMPGSLAILAIFLVVEHVKKRRRLKRWAAEKKLRDQQRWSQQ